MPGTSAVRPAGRGRPRRQGGRGRERLLVLGAVITLAALFAAGVLARGGRPSPAAAAPGRLVDGIGAGSTEQLAFHIHAHLAVYVNGRQESIPYGIGVLPPLQLQQTADGPFVVGGAAFYWLHTHDSSGVIHIESPVRRQYTLGEFFDIWGRPLGPTQVGPVRGPVTVLVDGRRLPGDPREVPLDAHRVIQLDVGSVVPFQPFTFPSGL